MNTIFRHYKAEVMADTIIYRDTFDEKLKNVRQMWITGGKPEEFDPFWQKYASTFVKDETRQFLFIVLRPQKKGGDFYDLEFNNRCHILMQLADPLESLFVVSTLYSYKLLVAGFKLTAINKLDIEIVFAIFHGPAKSNDYFISSYTRNGDMEDWTVPVQEGHERDYMLFSVDGFVEVPVVNPPIQQEELEKLKQIFNF